MYEILENPTRMSRDEIKKEYKGKWVFLVEPEGKIGCFMKSAIPIVIADIPWEGYDAGIYQKFIDDYESNMDLSFIPCESVTGFREVI